MKSILLAIMFLVPGLGPTTAKKYAGIIDRVSVIYQIDPLLVVSIIHVETAKTWKKKIRSVTNDFGLGQIHVSKDSNPELLGREEVLFDPATNIRYAAKTLAMWKSWHVRVCDERHPWWAHYQAGRVIRRSNRGWSKKVGALHRMLQLRFYLLEKDDVLSRNLNF